MVIKAIGNSPGKAAGEADASEGVLIRGGREAGEGRAVTHGPGEAPAHVPDALSLAAGGSAETSEPPGTELCLGFWEPGK